MNCNPQENSAHKEGVPAIDDNLHWMESKYALLHSYSCS